MGSVDVADSVSAVAAVADGAVAIGPVGPLAGFVDGTPDGFDQPVVVDDAPAAEAAPLAGTGTSGATLPVRAGLFALAGFAAVVVAGRAVRDIPVHRPVLAAVLTLGAVVVQYLALFGLCLGVSRRWGTGSLRRDLGARFRPGDVTPGMVAWLAGVGAVAFVAAVLRRLGTPTATNNPLLAAGRSPAAALPSWLALSCTAVVMVLVAPMLEELLFRGIVQRSFGSRLPVVPCLLVQATAFGLFHADPRRGAGNAGLVVVLATVGLVLGIVTHRRHGELGAGTVAHALHNGLAFAIGVAALH